METESVRVGSVGWGNGVGRSVLFHGDRVSVCGDELVLNVGPGDSCTMT